MPKPINQVLAQIDDVSRRQDQTPTGAAVLQALAAILMLLGEILQELKRR